MGWEWGTRPPVERSGGRRPRPTTPLAVPCLGWERWISGLDIDGQILRSAQCPTVIETCWFRIWSTRTQFVVIKQPCTQTEVRKHASSQRIGMNAIPTTAVDALFINTFKPRPDELYKERRHRHLKALLPVTTLPLRICQCLVLQFQSAFWDYWREAAFHTSTPTKSQTSPFNRILWRCNWRIGPNYARFCNILHGLIHSM